MYPITQSIENWLRKRSREFVMMATVNDVEYHDNVLLDFSIENSLSLSDELELGTVIPNKLTIRFRTRQEFPPNAKIVPHIALKSDNLTWQDADIPWEDANFPWAGGHTEWMPLGEFYIDQREYERGVWTYTCYDALVFADTPYVSQLSYPTTMQAVWDEICQRLGYIYDGSVQINPSYIIGAGPAGYSMRQVMGFIAAANSACAYMGKDGILRFKRISASAPVDFEMTEADYVRVKQTNPIKTYSRVVIIYDVDDGLFYEAGEGDDSQTLFIENPFGTQQMADDILAEINGFAYTPISMPARGFPHLDQGDIIRFETVESLAWEDADMSWDEADFPWDGAKQYQTIILHQVLDFRGGLSMQIEAPSISEQQSEFPVEGTLTEAVNRLNRNAVRYGKPYYGITHSREEGIVIQREDGKAKAVFNADELSFYKGATKALYFDVQNDRYVFGGHLQAASGTFTGKVEAGQIIGGTIQGTNINGATITGGVISGTVIRGGSVYGTYISSSEEYPRAELSVSNHLIAARQDPSNYIAIQAQGQGNVPALAIVAGGSLVGFLNRSFLGTTIGTFNGENLNFQPSGSLQINGQNGVSGVVYVAATQGGPANIPIVFTKGMRTG